MKTIMKKATLAMGCFGFFSLFFLFLNSTSGNNQVIESQDFVPNEVLVKFKIETENQNIVDIVNSIKARIITHNGTEISSGQWNSRVLSSRSFMLDPSTLRLLVPEEIGATGAIDILKSIPYVEYAEKNWIRHIFVDPDDTRFSELWGLKNTGQTGGTADADIDAPEAWNIYTGNPDMVVAVLDSGINYNHVDLQSNIWINTDEIPGNSVDDDGNGYVDDYRGWNFVSDTNDPMDNFSDVYHGTHVSGTIGAVGNNDVGVAGVNWNVKLMAVKVLNSSGGGTDADITNGIDYATINGAKISNNSYGGSGFSQTMLAAIQRAGAAGQLFVAAAGNGNPGSNNNNSPIYPASYNCSNIVAVLGTDDNDNLGTYSNYGSTSVDIGAPGGTHVSNHPERDILSTSIADGYQTLYGTSMAAPHVAGVAALAKGKCSALSVSQLKSRLLAKVDILGSLYNKCVSGGRLNAYNVIYDSAAPNGTPSNISVTATGWSTITVGWQDNSTNEIGFEVQRKIQGDPAYSYLNSADNNHTTMDDGDLLTTITYYYKLRAYNMAGNTDYTAEAYATIPADAPDTPTGLDGDWSWDLSTVELTWIDQSNNEEHFIVERKEDGSSQWQVIVELGQNETAYQDSDVYGDTFYYYRIKVVN
ncbi:MAG: S8 family serine peptidase, partial [Candidatus Aminicenantes bacterium]|nr:S8 family serine peptidase [Candidatus Aminicenantes bacterium]